LSEKQGGGGRRSSHLCTSPLGPFRGREGKRRLRTFEHYCLTNLSFVGRGWWGLSVRESWLLWALCTCLFFMMNSACMHAYTPLPPLQKFVGFNAQCCVVGSMHACSTWCSWDMYISAYKQKKCWFLHVMLLASQILNPWPQMMGSKVAAKFKLVAIKSILVWIRPTIFFPSTLDQPRTCDRTMWI
jgi:hypothetical protein